MNKDLINTERAPSAIGPYSQGIRNGEFIFLSMQIGIDPVTQHLVNGGVKSQTRQIFDNITEILNQAGTHLNQVVKTTVFIKEMKNFKPVNDIYIQYFDIPYPARSVVGVNDLPLSAEIAIEIIAIR